MTTKQVLKQYSNTQIEETINKWIHGETNRQILKMSFIDHKSYEEIAEFLQISTTTVYRKIKGMKMTVFSHLNG